ncbi:hypothetical protein CDAR_375571 [Caerostris darwini]|uniref:Uncharacterized protein n=1 Tax=Caerostris darwini TaxID=1538125 RepID=A0AAV4S8E5_9ARAC|nr:hypothetical protein CDAR_375571 [Caerostris darwini]
MRDQQAMVWGKKRNKELGILGCGGDQWRTHSQRAQSDGGVHFLRTSLGRWRERRRLFMYAHPGLRSRSGASRQWDRMSRLIHLSLIRLSEIAFFHLHSTTDERGVGLFFFFSFFFFTHLGHANIFPSSGAICHSGNAPKENCCTGRALFFSPLAVLRL